MREVSFAQKAILAIVVCMAVVEAAHAKQPDLVVSGLHLNAGDPAIVGEIRTVAPGEVLFGTTLVQPDTAFVRRNFNERLHGLRAKLTTFESLRRTRVGDPAYYQLSSQALVYCAEQRRLSGDERRQVIDGADKDGRASRQPVAFDSEVRVCLIDDEANGIFDRGFVHGARSDEAQRTVTISPLPYVREENQQIEDRFVRFEYGGVGSLTGSVILLTCDLVNQGHGLQTLALMYDQDGSSKVVQGRRGIGGSYPKTVEFGPVRIAILAVNKETKAMTYRVDQTFDYRQVKLIMITPYGFGSKSYSYW